MVVNDGGILANKCANIPPPTYNELAKSTDHWICRDCDDFKFSDSFYEDSFYSVEQNSSSTHDDDSDIFKQISAARTKHPSKFLCGYLNINSFRYKFPHVKDLLLKNTIGLLFISETKLDDFFVRSVLN